MGTGREKAGSPVLFGPMRMTLWAYAEFHEKMRGDIFFLEKRAVGVKPWMTDRSLGSVVWQGSPEIAVKSKTPKLKKDGFI